MQTAYKSVADSVIGWFSYCFRSEYKFVESILNSLLNFSPEFQSEESSSVSNRSLNRSENLSNETTRFIAFYLVFKFSSDPTAVSNFLHDLTKINFMSNWKFLERNLSRENVLSSLRTMLKWRHVRLDNELLLLCDIVGDDCWTTRR